MEKELEDLRQGEDCNLYGLDGSEESLPDLVDRASSLIDRSLSQSICDRENGESEKLKKLSKISQMVNTVFAVAVAKILR